ncbi:MAG: HAD-IIA family hydrolase [Cardiobacteriaceae bacterium]|nr:HAD-IIA family hydrolase [Cardiobacteriaceae bacterium]
MPAQQAYRDLETIRHRLPKQPPKAHWVADFRDNVLALANDYDSFWFDAFGVLNVGNQAIEGSVDAIKALRAMGKQVLVVSNACARSKAVLTRHIQGFGFDFREEEIVSSRDALLAGLPQDLPQPFGIIGLTEYQNDLPKALYHFQDHPRFFEDSASFLFMSSLAWNDDWQKRFVAALRDNPRPIHVGNPDLIAPQGKTSSIEPGTYTLLLPEDLFSWVRIYGKPFPSIFEIAAKRCESLGKPFNPQRTLMLGDTLHTDILGANAFGIQSALVSGHGFLKGLDVLHHIQDSQIYPTHIIPQL